MFNFPFPWKIANVPGKFSWSLSYQKAYPRVASRRTLSDDFKFFPVPTSPHRCARTKSGGKQTQGPSTCPAKPGTSRDDVLLFFPFRLLQQMCGLGMLYSLNFTNPPTTVATTLPCNCQPSKGEFLDLECESVA